MSNDVSDVSDVSDGCDFGGVLGDIRSRDCVVDRDVAVAAPLVKVRVWSELCRLRRKRLHAPPRLRTVRATFTAYGSSIL